MPPVGGVHRLFRADGWFAFGSYDGVHISKTLNEIDGMGQKTFTGKMAISKEDYSQLTALAK